MDRLWSPWRYRYVSTTSPTHECIFCSKIAENNDPANYIVLRAARNFILLNLYPYTSGHLMIAPYEHVATLEDAHPDTLEEMIQQPGCPNLYWALTDLPSPLVDLRKGLQGNRALVAADLGAVPEPGPASELDAPSTADLDRHARADERETVGPESTAVAREVPPAEQAHDQPGVLRREHPVPAHEPQQRERAAVERRGSTPQPLEALRRRWAAQVRELGRLRLHAPIISPTPP